MKKRSSSFTVLGLLFIGIGITLLDDNRYLQYGFLGLGTALLLYSILIMVKK